MALEVAVVPAIPVVPVAPVPEVKPRLRGWLHAGMLPAIIAAGVCLIISAQGVAAKATCSVFVASAILLFGCSGVYHLGRWSVRVKGVLRRLDHSNIAVIIAGTYTPLAVLALPKPTGPRLLVAIWLGAVAAIGLRMIWINAPRWSYVPVYLALGWAAVWFIPQFGHNAGHSVAWLIAAGGLAYSLGAVVYASKRPNPWPRWFGFHEIFHLGTVAGFTCHFIAVWQAAH